MPTWKSWQVLANELNDLTRHLKSLIGFVGGWFQRAAGVLKTNHVGRQCLRREEKMREPLIDRLAGSG